MIRPAVRACCLLLFVGSPLFALTAKIGEEIQVSMDARSKLAVPSAALDSSRAIVAWESPRAGILGRRLALDSGGEDPTPMVLVAKLPPSAGPGRRFVTDPREPAVANDGQGGFYLLWTRERTSLAAIPFLGRRTIIDRDVLCRHFGSDGTALGQAKQVHSNGIGWQDQPRVARLADGSLFILWHSDDRDAATSRNDGLFGRVLDADCSPRGEAFLVSDPPAGPNAVNAAVAVGADRVAVAWEGRNGETTSVLRRLFEPGGGALGAPERADTSPGGRPGAPSIAYQSGVGYLVLWQRETEESGRTRIYGQRLSERGELIGDELVISEGDVENESAPSVVAAGLGFFAVWIKWERTLPLTLQGVELDASGAPVCASEAINSFQPGAQHRTSLVSDGLGRLLAVWEGYFERQRRPGISAQFMTLEP